MGTPHEHLRLSRQVPRGARIKVRRGFGGQTKYPDQPAHARQIAAEVAQLKRLHAQRVRVLGVDPELVIVLHVNALPDEASLHAANLYVLEWLDDRVIAAAPTDSELTAFLARVSAYQRGPRTRPDEVVTDDGNASTREREPTAEYQGLLDRIDRVRAFGAEDVPTAALLSSVAAADPADPLRVDLHCWCPDDPDDARVRHDTAAAAVLEAGGVVLDRTLRHVAGLSLLRVEVPASAIGELAQTRLVRRLDVLPRPDLSRAETLGADVAALPTVLPPREDAPIVAVIDSGIRSGHALLAPAVIGVLAQSFPDGGDGWGHGTFVASLALYGSLEPLLSAHVPLQAAGRLVSVRVLSDDGKFPDTHLWESDLLAAIEDAVALGARVINLSIGDERSPYASERPTPLGAAIDDVARRHDVVIVVSAGNYRLSSYAASDDLATSYAFDLLDDPAAGVLDPASSALALSVGALSADDNQGFRPPADDIDRMPMGGQGMASPITRRGPGARGMIKPDVAMPGGGAEHDTTTGRAVAAAHRGVIGAAAAGDRVLTAMSGTSASAPLVTHAALTALAHNPEISAKAVRALVLLSVREHGDWFATQLTPSQRRHNTERLGGYGRPDAARAAYSSDHRVVLLAEAAIPLDEVQLYRVPVPSSFFDPGGFRKLAVALTYDPPVRATRLEYLASNMHVNVYRGLDLDEVAQAYIDDVKDMDVTAEAELWADPAAPTPGDIAGLGKSTDVADDTDDYGRDADSADADEADDDQAELGRGPKTIRNRLVSNLQPSERRRSRGANQYASRVFGTRLKAEGGLEFIVAVHNKRNWPSEQADQPYALAVALERDEGRRELYADVRAFIELEAAALEAQVDTEIELRGR